MAAWIGQRIAAALADTEPTADPEVRLLRAFEAIGARLRWADVPIPYCVHTDAGPLVTFPRAWQGEQLLAAMRHEFGHADGTCDIASWLYGQAAGEYRLLVLARRWEMEEERIARQYEAAWRETEV